MKKEKNILIIAIAISLILIFFINGQDGCKPEAECYSHSDCIKVQTTCCPCNMGGNEACMPRAMAQIYEAKLKECPSANELICTALYNCKIKNCSCVNGKCVAN
ncbi:MAG: hypothetical protein N3G19_03685 [Candidatus Pacearchaeota archaeon]|nr:hypothetical protein [Candidatus Pacearchaeota archaeon]